MSVTFGNDFYIPKKKFILYSININMSSRQDRREAPKTVGEFNTAVDN